jgi:hypothetical protein
MEHDYKKIAKEYGFRVWHSDDLGWKYFDGYLGRWGYATEQEAWKACCVDNELMEDS